jgi:hypothetical protein
MSEISTNDRLICRRDIFRGWKGWSWTDSHTLGRIGIGYLGIELGGIAGDHGVTEGRKSLDPALGLNIIEKLKMLMRCERFA